MVAELGRVEIPGYAEALRRETSARAYAFAEVNVGTLNGLPARLMTMRLLHRLRLGRNGFVVPCRFDSDAEAYAHALDFVWKLHPRWKPAKAKPSMADNIRRALWQYRAAQVPPRDFVMAVMDYLDEMFFDSPFIDPAPRSSNGDRVRVMGRESFTPPIASDLASIIDLFAEGGYGWTPDQILDLPLVRLWQHARLILRRCYGVDCGSHAQRLAAAHMEKHNQQFAGN